MTQLPPSLPAAAPTIRELSTEARGRWIERLFSRFLAMYGQQFAAMWASCDLAEVKALWADRLGGFTADHIGAALRACEDRRYPPNLPEFVGLCRDQARRDGDGIRKLPAPRIDEATAAQRKAQIREMAERLARKWVDHAD